MSIIDECYEIKEKTAFICQTNSDGNEFDSLSLSVDKCMLRDNLPSFYHPFKASDFYEADCNCVYYISDLHLDLHIVNRLNKSATDSQVKKAINSVAKKLLSGPIENEIKGFMNPIVLFGGDVASSFTIAKLFYESFITQWRKKERTAYRAVKQEINNINLEIDRLVDNTASSAKNSKTNSTDSTTNEKQNADSLTVLKLKSRIYELEEAVRHYEYYSQKESYGLRVFAVLGNHEFWGFSNYNDCISAYKKLFSSLGIFFLNNECCSINWNRYQSATLIKDEEKDEYTEAIHPLPHRKVFIPRNTILVGSTGYACLNQTLNAKNNMYGTAIDSSKELELYSAWMNTFHKALQYAKSSHSSLIVLSHTPVTDWLNNSSLPQNVILFSGHTHKNHLYHGDNNTSIYADNQVGYYNNTFEFKRALLYKPLNPFASDKDGYRTISIDEYLEFFSYSGESITGIKLIEKTIRDKVGILYLIKKNDYYGFFIISPTGSYICNGGHLSKLEDSRSIAEYYSCFDIMVNRYIEILAPFRAAQESISKYIQYLGGSGAIHGSIIDIDFFSHIMLNPIDGRMVYYYSPSFGVVLEYPDLPSLLDARLPLLAERFYSQNESGSIQPIDENRSLGVQYIIDIKNSLYVYSRKINTLQRLFTKHVLRAWDTFLLDDSYKQVIDKELLGS